MKARLFVTAVLVGMFAGCAHQHGGHDHAEKQVDEEALADELFEKLCHDLERPPYYASSLRWGSVFEGMIAIGVLPEEADFQVRRAARSTVSARDVDKLLDKHEADAELFLDALDEAHIVAGSPPTKRADEDEFAYGLPSEDAVERWYAIMRLVDRPPRCGNSLHWLPVYKDLMRLGFSAAEGEAYCKRAVYAGMSRFTVEGLIDGSKRETEAFSENFEVALLKAENRRAKLPTRGLKAFFKGKVFTPKARPQTLDIGAAEAPAESSTLEKPQDAPAETAPPSSEEPAYEEPADAPSGMDDPPAGGADEAPAEGMEDPPMGDEPPADVPEGE